MATKQEKTQGAERSQEEMQQLLYQYQMLGAQAEALQKQNEMVVTGLEEMNTTLKTLEDMKGLKKGDEIMVPLGQGAFTRGTLGDTNNVLVDIGAGTLAMKSADDAIAILEKRKSRMEEMLKKVMQDLSRTQLGLASVEPELKRIMEQRKE